MSSIDISNRLHFIEMKNPKLYTQLIEFVADNPIFYKYLSIAASSLKSEIPSELKTIKDMLKYYVCFAGVNATYGEACYQNVRNNKLDKLTEKKRTIINEIIEIPEIKTREDFTKIKIKGVGEGAINFVRIHYFNDQDLAYPTDRIFQKGIKKIYTLEKVTVSQCKKIISGWKGNKLIGNSFCFQVAHYA